MAVTASSFKAAFPEFDSVPDATVTAAVNRAALYYDSAVWGIRYDEAVGLQAALFLISSPLGFRGRPNSASPSPYRERLDELLLMAPRRFLTIRG